MMEVDDLEKRIEELDNQLSIVKIKQLTEKYVGRYFKVSDAYVDWDEYMHVTGCSAYMLNGPAFYYNEHGFMQSNNSYRPVTYNYTEISKQEYEQAFEDYVKRARAAIQGKRTEQTEEGNTEGQD